MTASLSAKQEWASMWRVPLVSMLGLSGSAMFAYSSGIFMEDMTGAFGWTRAQFSSAFVLQMVAGLFTVPLVGWIVDRAGPRRVALWGIVPFALSFGLLGFVGGAIWEWWAVCVLMAATQPFIGQTVWVTCIIGRFHASRGLAIAVALAGLGLGSLIWPQLAAIYIKAFGWRVAFPAMAFSWVIIVLPMTIAFFFGPPRPMAATRTKAHKRSYIHALKSRTFVGLLVAGGMFSSAYFGTTVHFVPILRSNGLGLGTAAAAAGLIGLFSIIGRVLTGHLLDRLPTRPVAVVAFLLPAPAAILLLHGQDSVTLSLIAAALLGLATGAELDVITFIAARRFGLEVFASVYAIFMSIIGVCASSGPVIAGALFDTYRSYDLFLGIVPAMVIAGALLVAWIPISPTDESKREAPNTGSRQSASVP